MKQYKVLAAFTTDRLYNVNEVVLEDKLMGFADYYVLNGSLELLPTQTIEQPTKSK